MSETPIPSLQTSTLFRGSSCIFLSKNANNLFTEVKSSHYWMATRFSGYDQEIFAYFSCNRSVIAAYFDQIFIKSSIPNLFVVLFQFSHYIQVSAGQTFSIFQVKYYKVFKWIYEIVQYFQFYSFKRVSQVLLLNISIKTNTKLNLSDEHKQKNYS